jgi:hypothetical protein
MTNPADAHAPSTTPASEPGPSAGAAGGKEVTAAEAPLPSDGPPAPPSEKPRGYAFLLNVESVPVPADSEILPGHVLRRASSAEIESIRKALVDLAASDPHARYFWEQPWPPPDGPVQRLPPEAWRYFVVAFEGTNATMIKLRQVFTLSHIEPCVGFTIVYQAGMIEGGVIWNEAELFHALQHARDEEAWQFHAIRPTDVRELTRLFHAVQAHDHSVLDLRPVLHGLSSLNNMRHDSPLRFLGYFALLESLLTHAPKPTDPYDSITRQVKRKLSLLNHRLTKPIDYGARFGSAKSDTIWDKMYAYRSDIAHGVAPDFTKDLALLKRPTEALKLLRETTRAVARHGLAEPQLLVDLREC